MEERKSNEQMQDLNICIREIDAILNKHDVKDCLIVLSPADAWCVEIGGSPQSLSYAIKNAMISKFNGQDDLKRLVELLNNK